MKCTLLLKALFLVLVPILSGLLVFGQVPQTISYQGVLTDTSGTVVPDGDYNLTFRLYDVASGGTALWTEGQLVAVQKGIFNVNLGATNPLTLPFNKQYYLGVTVGVGSEFLPRILLTGSAYSFRATNTDSINGITAGGDLVGSYPNPIIKDNSVTTAKIVDGAVTSAKIAPGTSIPPGGTAGGDLTGIYPNPKFANNAVTSAKLADNSVTTEKIANGTITGSDINTATTISAARLQGGGTTGFNFGVYGYHSYMGNYGVLGSSSNGVYGYSSSSNGVYGESSSGKGVYGQSSSNNGVYGESSSGEGVYGYNSGSGNYGYLGSTWHGVVGYAQRGYAGLFTGDVLIHGMLSKGGGSFKIDHPLDPANKYLYHSFVESPDMMNIYNGVVTLDANGEAVVELPLYFETLNSDYRYQLTAIGAPAPNLYLAEEIYGNHFRIAGGKPGMKVSWQVTGIRQTRLQKLIALYLRLIKQVKSEGSISIQRNTEYQRHSG